MLTLPTPPYCLQKSLEKYDTHTHSRSDAIRKKCVLMCLFLLSAEIDQKLQEIMKQTGYLKIDGQVRSRPLFVHSGDVRNVANPVYLCVLSSVTQLKWRI